MTPRTQPTHKKLPRARVFVADYDASYPAEIRFETYETVADQHDNRPDLDAFHVAFIPTRTKREARQIIKAAPFLRMTEGEQLEIAGEALYSDANWSSTWAETTAQVRQGYKLQARAVLAAMGLNGRASK